MPESGNVRPAPVGDSKNWVEVDQRYWQDPRGGLVWQVVAWADAEISLSAIHEVPAVEVSVLLGFDAFARHYLIRWSDPKPLDELSNEEFERLLDEAMNDPPH